MSSIDYSGDSRVVITLDADGTNFRFSAMRGNQQVTQTVTMPSGGNDLERCLHKITEGIMRVEAQCPAEPVALSVAFPGPADYPSGIAGDLDTPPCFQGGLALGPRLAGEFGIPVFINRDGDLFTYGEAIAGFLPYINSLLGKAGNTKHYENLIGVTLDAGLDGGIVCDGKLVEGDNLMAEEMRLLRNKVNLETSPKDGVSIGVVRRVYASETGIPIEKVPSIQKIERIACGKSDGCQEAAIEAYRRLGEVVGNTMENVLPWIDGLAIVGGALSKGHQIVLPAILEELNRDFTAQLAKRVEHIASMFFNLEDPPQLETFLTSQTQTGYYALPRVGVGISRLGSNRAVAIGAYAFALYKIDRRSAALSQKPS